MPASRIGLQISTTQLNMPEVLVDPVERAADHLLRVVAEFVEDRDRRIAGELRPLGADLLVVPQVLGMHLGIGEMIERAQQHAAPRVERHAAGDVGMPDDEIGDRAHLGLRRWIGAGAELLEFLPPIGRKIAI